MLAAMISIATFAAPPPATFRFARGVLSDDMVLQSAPQQAMIWGFVPLNATVTVTLGAITLNTTIGPDQAHDLDSTVPAMNTFRVLLPATPASFDKYNISATYSFFEPVGVRSYRAPLARRLSISLTLVLSFSSRPTTLDNLPARHHVWRCLGYVAIVAPLARRLSISLTLVLSFFLPPVPPPSHSLLWPIEHAVSDCLVSALLECVKRELHGSEQVPQHETMRLRLRQ